MSKAHYQPPFTLTSDIVTLVADIAEQVGRLSAQPNAGMDLRLRRINTLQKVNQKTPQKTPQAILSLLRRQPEMSFQQMAAKLGKSESAIKPAVHGLREAGVCNYWPGHGRPLASHRGVT